jgi:uncharacterized protein (DUF1499 family)
MDCIGLELRATRNQLLLCPPGMETKATAHGESPMFAIPADRLLEAWRRVALREPRVFVVRDDRETGQCDFVQRSLIFQFSDTITVQVVPIDDDQSTCAVYRRSSYGRGDLCVNWRPVGRWLRLVQAEVSADP